jgi:DNA-binding transcriptional ArsR family regulator
MSAPVAPTRDTILHPGVETLDLAQILRTVGDPLRLAMVRSLAEHGELLCGALGEQHGLPKSTGSYHLRLLREAGVTRTRQAGTLRYVSLRHDDLESRFPGLVSVITAPVRG